MSKSSTPDSHAELEDETFVRPSDHLPDVPTKTSWQDKMKTWNPEPHNASETQLLMLDQPLEDEEDDVKGFYSGESEDLEEGETVHDDYFNATAESLAFQWLQSILQRELTLHSPEKNLMRGIGQQISHILPKPRISSNQGTETHKMIFQLEWDPMAFVQAQEYSQAPKDIANAITLTGTPRDCQALSVSQYLRQTWPMSSGFIIQLIQDLVSKPGMVHQSKFKITSDQRSMPDLL